MKIPPIILEHFPAGHMLPQTGDPTGADIPTDPGDAASDTTPFDDDTTPDDTPDPGDLPPVTDDPMGDWHGRNY
jgi:hypothetical protein